MKFRWLALGCMLGAAFLSLSSCSPRTGSTGTPQESSRAAPGVREVVDAARVFNNPRAYEGRSIYFYLTHVYPAPVPIGSGHLLSSDDERARDGMTMKMNSLTLSPPMLARWGQLGLDSYRLYTVTFKARPTDASGRKEIYNIEVEDFIVNADEGPQIGVPAPQQVVLGRDGLPVTQLQVPAASADLRALELYPEQYRGKVVRLDTMLLGTMLQSYDDKYLLVAQAKGTKILLRKDLAQGKLDAAGSYAFVEITGRFEGKGPEHLLYGEAVRVGQK